VYLTSVNVSFLAFFAENEINKLRVISEAQNSDSPASTIFRKLNGISGEPAVRGLLGPLDILPLLRSSSRICTTDVDAVS
jgi:hypothetical protein